MPLYPYPDVPNYPGVPPLVRSAASSTIVNLALSTVGGILLSALQSQSQWGIYSSTGKQLGGVSSLSLVQSLVAQPSTLSTFSVDFMRDVRISSFPLEAGSFASYNKVQNPANPTVVLTLDGPETARTAFLNAVNAACISTDLYSVITPEVTYVNYSITRYTYRRSAAKGATLLLVEITLEEVRQVSATYAKTTPITNPLNPASSSQVSDGKVQPAVPDVSTLQSLFNKFSKLAGVQ